MQNISEAAKNMHIKGPVTHDEIKKLDQFLLDAEGIEESMDISTLGKRRKRFRNSRIRRRRSVFSGF